ncbi:TIGR01457 family HAD-type hydrolase [Rummeliibacillus pycnus]|uniref:TIGR01457 family HAD-type hydrolase n=1 Tax=Rummeliibacillus pycnus TaxID=101070 RepID=UPI000C998BA5|nr:TIGR01457 family HAD-type hydrolase [Rummeliibacillus pycnus]
MKQYKAYCFDLDGTVYRGLDPILEAKEFIHYLQKQGIEPFFATNNAKMTRAQVQKKLHKMGIEAKTNRIMTSAIATAKYIANHYPNKTVKVLGGDGLRQALLDEGMNIVDKNPNVFVLGMNPEITYQMLADACYDIQNGAVFVATNGDIKYPSEYGFAPGNGALAELIHHVTDVTPFYIGKPAPHMLEIIRQEFQLQKEEMLMIGDNYDTDILAGINYGIDTLHVNTGVTRTEVVQRKEQPATYTVETLLDLL